MYILAFALLMQIETTAPRLIEPFKTEEACMVAARKAAANTPELRTREAREAGAAFVCLKVMPPQV